MRARDREKKKEEYDRGEKMIDDVMQSEIDRDR